MSRRFLRLLTIPVLLTIAGCGGEDRPERVPVSGRVLIDGKPVEHGSIMVMPKGDRAAHGKIGPDGRFELMTFEPGDGCVPGTHQVMVIATETIDAHSQRWHAPQKYRDPTKSNLTLTVTEATDSAEIKLTWDGGEPFVERANGGE